LYPYHGKIYPLARESIIQCQLAMEQATKKAALQKSQAVMPESSGITDES
jgi:hypothetical protein